MGFVSHWWIIGLLIVVLIIFGPGKLPQIGGAIGTAIKEFRKASSELRDEVTRATSPVDHGPSPEPPHVETASKAESEQHPATNS
jgi:sec-independent protein translocase protein TatA